MRIGIFARRDDPLAERTRAVALRAGHEVVVVPFLADNRIACDGDAYFADGEDVSGCDGFVLRQFPSPHALPAVLGPLSADDWWRLSLHQQECSSVAVSCIMDMELRGRPIVNPYLACAPFDHKPLQLAVLRRVGLPLPATLITNTPAAARAFVQTVGEAIVKPAVGGAETELVTPELLDRLDAITAAPAIFQERVRGDDIRVTVVAGRVVSAVEIPGHAVDYRRGAAYREGKATYVRHALSPSVEAYCLGAAAACRHVLSGIDLKRRPSGDYVVLEANSAPAYLDIELKTGAPITHAVIEYLEAGRPAR